MKFTTCAQALSAAAIASAAAVSIPGKQADAYGYSHSHKIKGITWDEAVEIMGGAKSGDNDFHGEASSKTASAGNNTVIRPVVTQAVPSSSCTDNVRIEWNNLSDGHKLAYVQAVKCLMDAPPLGVWDEARNIWDEMTWVHDQLSERIHGLDTFLPWHRYYLYTLKTLLAEQCGYTGPMPWWHETKYTGNFAGSGIFEPQYFGALPPLTNRGEGTCITDGVS
jgi:tyrosinase